MPSQIPQSPTPEWAISCYHRIIKDDDQEQIHALLELLAGIAPDAEKERSKSEAAWALIDYGYKRTEDCEESCKRYLGVAVYV